MAKPLIILEEVLRRKHKSKLWFAKACQKDYSQTFAWYRPGYNPTFKTLCLWARVLKCRVRDLIKE